ncbi:MAG: hypothetical protein Q8O40_08085 [Chloroflexota bacterium]|nr:hypothetical protein [Chloroflexota bacterium]
MLLTAPEGHGCRFCEPGRPVEYVESRAGNVVTQGDPPGEHTRWTYDAQAGCWKVTLALKQADGRLMRHTLEVPSASPGVEVSADERLMLGTATSLLRRIIAGPSEAEVAAPPVANVREYRYPAADGKSLETVRLWMGCCDVCRRFAEVMERVPMRSDVLWQRWKVVLHFQAVRHPDSQLASHLGLGPIAPAYREWVLFALLRKASWPDEALRQVAAAMVEVSPV